MDYGRMFSARRYLIYELVLVQLRTRGEFLMIRSLMTMALVFAGVSVAQVPAVGQANPDPACAVEAVNAVIEWNRTLLVIVRTPGAQPATIHSTRNFAMLHAAIFDAVTNITGTFPPYLVSVPGTSPQASQPAAADQAAHDVLVSLYPAFQMKLDTQLTQDLALVPDGQDKVDGINVGQKVAAAILAARANDGSAVPQPAYVPGTHPGDYQLTPPNFASADFTQWPQVTPFALRRADEFLPPPPPALTSEEYTNVFTEVKSLGLITSTVRTPDQTQIGTFWNGNIQDFWNEIAQTAALTRHLDLPQTAHLFALLNIALADTTIAFFEAKYVYNFWRPVTAIRAADTDNNPNTAPDPAWVPLPTKTAADPSYPGAHSAISFAAAEVLKLELGQRLVFDVTSESLARVTRHFTSFDEAAQEAGLSRIYAGQHYRTDHVAGKNLGRNVARSIFDSILLAQ
jgi:hypothetical protein